MSKALSVLRQETRTYLDEASMADWTDTEVDREINAGYHEVITGVMTTYEEFYIKTAFMNSVASQQEYTSANGLPTDIFKLRRVEINYDPSNSDSIARRARPVSIDAVLRDLGNSALGITVYRNPSYFFIGSGSGTSGATLGLIPEPTNTGTNAFKLWYMPLIADLVESTDEINIPYPDRYFKLIGLYAAAILLRKGQQEEAVAAKYLKDFQDGVEKMQEELEDRVADDQSFTTIDTIGDDMDYSQGGYY